MNIYSSRNRKSSLKRVNDANLLCIFSAMLLTNPMLLSILYVSLLEFGKKEIEGEEESAHQTRDEERKGGKTPDMDREERGRKQPLFPAHAFYPRRHDDGTEKYLFVFGIPRFLYLSAPPLATAASSSSPRRSRRERPLLNLKIFCSLTRLIEQVSLLGRPNAKKKMGLIEWAKEETEEQAFLCRPPRPLP